MKNEKGCSAKEKFLFSEALFSDETIKVCKVKSEKQLKDEHKGELFNKFFNWKRKENEVAIFTFRAYADLEIPKNFDCLFALDNPSEFVITPFRLTQSIYEGFFPIDAIEDGHKHLCVIEFENEIPKILKKIHIERGEGSDVPMNSFKIGVCDSNDFYAIKEDIDLKIELKKKYGNDWHKYYEYN